MEKFTFFVCFKLLASLLASAQFLSDTENTIMKPVKVICAPNPKRANASCSLKAVTRNEYHVNIKLDLLQPIRNFSVRFETFKFYNGYRPYIVNSKEYFCDFMAGRRHSVLLQVAKRFLDRYTNLNHSCPYTGSIIVRGLRYTPGSLPSVVPRGKYKMRFTLLDDTKLEPSIGQIDLYSEVFENKVRKKPQRRSFADHNFNDNVFNDNL